MIDTKLEEMEVDNKSKQHVKQELDDAGCNDETLEARYRALEVEKLKIGHDLEVLKKENRELKERIVHLEKEIHVKKNIDEQTFVDLTEPDELEELAMVNTALQYEKEKAEKDAASWKQMYEELASKIDEKGKQEEHLDRSNALNGVRLMVDLSSFSDPPNDGIPNLQNAGTPPSYESNRKYSCGVKDEAANWSFKAVVQAKKQLQFEDNNKGIAPRTPSVSKHVGIVDIDDSDDDLDGHEDMISFTPTAKRKRPSNVVNSDSESDDDDDDNVPISMLKKRHRPESPKSNVEDARTPVRRRIRTLGEAGKSPENVDSRRIPTTKDVDNDDSESKDGGSDSDGESLGGFIVCDDDVEGDKEEDGDDEEDEEEDEDGGGSSPESEDDDGDIDYKDIISTLRRSKVCESDWKFEGDMLSAFGKDPVLCMKAVCAIYRQQTVDEKVSKEAIHLNGRGFSKFDALRGSRLGEFLTGGDPKGDLKASVEELQRHDPTGVDLCRKFALHYSKQLFAIYHNREDPFFLPDDEI